jgi:hypothetical protein
MGDAVDNVTEAYKAIMSFNQWIWANIQYTAPLAVAGAVAGQLIWPDSPDSAFAIVSSLGTLIVVYNV